MKQLRMSKRVGVNYAAVFRSGSASVDGVINQVSEGGLSFICAAQLDVDEAGLFIFTAFDGEPPVSVQGEFVYMLPGKQGRPEERTDSRYGVRFIDTVGEQYENIINIIRFATVRQRYSVIKKENISADNK